MSRRVEALKQGLEVLFDVERCRLPRGTTAERRCRKWRRMRRKTYLREAEAIRLVQIEIQMERLQRERQAMTRGDERPWGDTS